METTARRLWQLLEPIHAVVYFSPEPLAALRAAGYKGFWMGYFANRAAPLGPAGPELVQALFYNFTPERVARALPTAWSFAGPDVALQARLVGSEAALRRQLADLAEGPEVAHAAELAWKAAASAPVEGRALYAANRALPEPAEPLAKLWHAATLLREHRGDGHVAALLTAGISGRGSHVLHALATGNPQEVYRVSRDFEDHEWDHLVDAHRVRGLVDEHGRLTEAGRELKDEIERRTDELAAAAYTSLGESETETLAAALHPLATAIVQAGDIPLDSPMGLNLRDVLATP